MASAPNREVALISDDDLSACWKVMSQSFGQDAPFVAIYFPHHDTPAGQASGVKRLTAWKHEEPNSVFLKSVTTAEAGSETITGFAIWTFMTEPPPAELDQAENVTEVWPDANDREFMTRLWRCYVAPRTDAVKSSQGKGIYVLELLAVHPEYQRRGVGKALVEWGTKAADEKEVDSVVEGTPVARGLYEKCGFRATIEMSFDVGDEFKDRKKPTLNFLERPPNRSEM